MYHDFFFYLKKAHDFATIFLSWFSFHDSFFKIMIFFCCWKSSFVFLEIVFYFWKSWFFDIFFFTISKMKFFDQFLLKIWCEKTCLWKVQKKTPFLYQLLFNVLRFSKRTFLYRDFFFHDTFSFRRFSSSDNREKQSEKIVIHH